MCTNRCRKNSRQSSFKYFVQVVLIDGPLFTSEYLNNFAVLVPWFPFLSLRIFVCLLVTEPWVVDWVMPASPALMAGFRHTVQALLDLYLTGSHIFWKCIYLSRVSYVRNFFIDVLSIVGTSKLYLSSNLIESWVNKRNIWFSILIVAWLFLWTDYYWSNREQLQNQIRMVALVSFRTLCCWSDVVSRARFYI